MDKFLANFIITEQYAIVLFFLFLCACSMGLVGYFDRHHKFKRMGVCVVLALVFLAIAMIGAQ